MLAISYGAIDDVLGGYGDELDGKVVVDITNPRLHPSTPLDVQAGSAAQEIAEKARGAKVVKAFNTTFAGTLAEGQWPASRSTSSSPADDDDAKQRSAGSPPTAACAPSTPARSRAPTSSRRSATCTWRCSSRSDRLLEHDQGALLTSPGARS